MSLNISFATEIFTANPFLGESGEFKATSHSDSPVSTGYSYFTEAADSSRSHELTRRRHPPDSSRQRSHLHRQMPLKGFHERESEDPPLHPLSPRPSLFLFGSAGNEDSFLADEEILGVLLGPADFDRTVSGRWTHYSATNHGFRDRVIFDYAFGVYDGKHVLPQISSYACTAACSAMLILDHGRKPNIVPLFERVSGDTDLISQDLYQAGLSPRTVTTPDGDAIDRTVLNILIQYGPCIIFLNAGNSSHAVVLDEFDAAQNHAVIRDPFHGWMIRTTAHTISQRFLGHAVYLKETVHSSE